MLVELNPQSIFKKLIVVLIVLCLVNLLSVFSTFYFEHDTVYGLVPLFDFNGEQNIPSLYSSLLLLVAGVLLALIAWNHRQNKMPYLQWAILAFIFLMLGIDETACIHERFTTPTKALLHSTSGYLHFAWVIPYGIFLLVFGVSFMKFLFRLPREIMRLFILSGLIYVSGAIGFEMLGSMEAYQHGGEDLVYGLLYTCEESLEMLGASLFIFTLLKYAVSEFGHMTITVKNKPEM